MWHAGRTMSPAEFCRLAGDTKRRASECIIIRQTRQTLAQFEASARAQASWRKRRLTAEDFVASAEIGALTTKWAPEIGTMVHVASCATEDPRSQTPCADQRQQEQGKDKTEQEQSRHEAGDGKGKREEKEEPARPREKRPNVQDVESLAAGAGDGGFRRGVILARSIDGWYKVLLVEVIAKQCLASARPAACHSRLNPDEICAGCWLPHDGHGRGARARLPYHAGTLAFTCNGFWRRDGRGLVSRSSSRHAIALCQQAGSRKQRSKRRRARRHAGHGCRQQDPK